MMEKLQERDESCVFDWIKHLESSHLDATSHSSFVPIIIPGFCTFLSGSNYLASSTTFGAPQRHLLIHVFIFGLEITPAKLMF
jgi:hypothetical protein